MRYEKGLVKAARSTSYVVVANNGQLSKGLNLSKANKRAQAQRLAPTELVIRYANGPQPASNIGERCREERNRKS